MISLTPEMIAGAIISLIAAIFWHWVRSIEKHRDEDRKELNYIQHEYVRRDDYKEDTAHIYYLLKEIKTQLDKLDSKLDKKADRT